MEKIDQICKNCGHYFWYHQKPNVEFTWYCEFGNCDCDTFYPKQSGADGDEIEVQYDDQSYRNN